MAERFFIKKTNEWGALYYFFPNAIYEFRDHIWQVREILGNVNADIFISNAFQNLQAALVHRNVTFSTISSPVRGTSDIFPKTWVCSTCGYFRDGELEDSKCSFCHGEMRQFPFIVLCDHCGYLNRLTPSFCNRCHSNSSLGIVWYNRRNSYTIHMICKHCLENVLVNHGITCNRHCSECNLERKLCLNYREHFFVYSELEVGARCPQCNEQGSREQPAKRIMNATSTFIIQPRTINAFDQDIPTIIEKSITSARRELELNPDGDFSSLFDQIEQVFGIEDIYLAEIFVLNCTYGYVVGNCPVVNHFPGDTIYVKSDRVTSVIVKYQSDRLPDINEIKHDVLHASSHALLQTAGYVTGLGNESYREFVDDDNDAVMIYCIEAGGCDMLVRVPQKLIYWLQHSRALIRGCKNQCDSGCAWCLYIKNWQCIEFNQNLDRSGLNSLWQRPLLLRDVNNE